MPTGYTAQLIQKDQSFPEFALTCARAFGACIDMRDEPLDKPIPDEFKPSSYYAERLASAKQELATLEGMTQGERIAFGRNRKRMCVDSAAKHLACSIAENGRINRMRMEVEKWNPPTTEHTGLKQFMLEQLSISKNDLDYPNESLRAARSKSPLQYWDTEVSALKQTINYLVKHEAEERQRAASRTEWVRLLRASLKAN